MCLIKLVIICTVLNGYFYQTYLVKLVVYNLIKDKKNVTKTAVYVHIGAQTTFIHLSYVNAQNVTYILVLSSLI